MRAQRMGWKYALIAAGLLVMAVLVMDFNGRMAELRRLSAERELVSVKATSVFATRAALEAQIAYANSDQAVERWAYEDGHMVRGGDQPVVPVAARVARPTPTPTPLPSTPEPSTWQRWWDLFFGPHAP